LATSLYCQPTVATAAEPTTAVVVDERAVVPVLDGSLSEVELRLRGAGLAVGTISRVSSPELAGTVLGGSRSAGERLEPGSAVDLQVASGSNVVPDVTGTSPGAARALLEAAGFVPVVVESEAVSSTITETVLGTQPGPGTVLRLGVSVTLEVQRAGTGEAGDA